MLKHGADPSLSAAPREDDREGVATYSQDLLEYVAEYDYPRTLKVLVDSPLVKTIDLNTKRTSGNTVLAAMVCERDHETYPPPSVQHLQVIAAMLNKGADVRVNMGYGNSIVGALNFIADDIQEGGVDNIHPNKIIVLKMLLLAAGTFTDDEIDNTDVTESGRIEIDDEGVQRLQQFLRTCRDEVEQLKRSYLATLMSFNRLADPTKPTPQNLFAVKDLTTHILSFIDLFYGVSPRVVFANKAWAQAPASLPGLTMNQLMLAFAVMFVAYFIAKYSGIL